MLNSKTQKTPCCLSSAMHSSRILIKSVPLNEVENGYGIKKRSISILEKTFQNQYRELIQEVCQGKIVFWAYANPDDSSLIDVFALCEFEDDGLLLKLAVNFK